MMKYQILYEKIKNDILNSKYEYQERIPSIRQMVHQTGYSKTTVESAYLQLLAEGYIQSINKSGYYVDVKVQDITNVKILNNNDNQERKIHYPYDFSGRSVDQQSFDLTLWHKYLKKVIQEENELYDYGNPQGELTLRRNLCKYTLSKRGVETLPSQVFVGSGFQSLLHIICGVFDDLVKIAMPKSGFIYAMQVFIDYHIQIEWIEEDEEGIIVENLKDKNVQLIYINSSSSGKYAKPLSISRRMALIEYAKQNDIYIIEDDHNGELRYQVRPIEAMQKQATEYIIYIGSFSKLLIPSIRLSYMVMPIKIVEKYQVKKNNYHQTVSKFEQLALNYYIEDGALDRQLKKLRRLYLNKSKLMLECIERYLNCSSVILEETALRVKIKLTDDFDLKAYCQSANEHGIAFLVESDEIILSFSSISFDRIEEGIKQLSIIKPKS